VQNAYIEVLSVVIWWAYGCTVGAQAEERSPGEGIGHHEWEEAPGTVIYLGGG